MRFSFAFLSVREFYSPDDTLCLSRVCVRLCAMLHPYLSNKVSLIE